jgi:hypothetical protein
MNKLLLAIAAALLFAASGCGGGAGRSTVMPSGAGATATSTAVGSATVQLTIPIATAAANAVGHATPQYVSSGTASITIKQGSALLGTFNTTATSPGCAATTAGLQCSFSIAPLVGTNQVFTVTAYTQANAAGAVLSSGTTTATVAANTNTPIAVTMGGQVASLGVTLPNVAAGSAVSAPFVVLAKDAAGSTIIGPGSYSSPITISAGANGGLIQLSVNGGSAASSIQVTSPADVPRIVYNGHNISFATITASTTPPGASAVTLSTFFAPVPTVVATHVGTFPNVSVYANTGPADTQTGSFWLGVLDNTLGQWALEHLCERPERAHLVHAIRCGAAQLRIHGPGYACDQALRGCVESKLRRVQHLPGTRRTRAALCDGPLQRHRAVYALRTRRGNGQRGRAADLAALPGIC